MSIDQIREAKPVPNTIHDLVHTLSVKLDSAARYGLYKEDAREDGYDDCLELFDRLAGYEQRAIEELLGYLDEHLPAAAQSGAQGS